MERLEKIRVQGYEGIVDLLPHKALTHIPSNISAMQEQIKALLAGVLNLDGGKEPVQKKMWTTTTPRVGTA